MEEKKSLPIHICEHTGLLYINDVPFTKNHLKKIRKFYKYGNKVSNGQFKHSIIVYDTASGATTTVDADLISDIFKLYNMRDIASDKDFTM